MDGEEEIGRPRVGFAGPMGEEDPRAGATQETREFHFCALALELRAQSHGDSPHDVGFTGLGRVSSDGARIHSSMTGIDIDSHRPDSFAVGSKASENREG